MIIHPIRVLGDPALRQTSREVPAPYEAQTGIVESMKATMRAAGGVGLAAPQIGLLRRILVYEGRGGMAVLINPTLVEAGDGGHLDEEACLSLPGVVLPVARWGRIRVRGYDLTGAEVDIVAQGPEARVLQHELDHLAGLLIVDRVERHLRRRALGVLDELARRPPIGV